MKVLAISNLYPPGLQGGYELGCSHVVEALRADGHQVRVVTSHGDGGDSGVARVLRMAPVFDRAVMSAAGAAERRALRARAGVRDPANVEALAREAGAFDPDVAYLWNLYGIGGLALLGWLEERGVPWLWHLMDAVPRQLCTIDRAPVPELVAALAGGSPGRHLACSARVVGEIRAGGVELNGPVELVPNWVTGPVPGPRDDLGAGPVLRVVSAAGVLVEHKGTDVLVDAAALLARSHPGRVTVDLYGREDDGRFRDRVVAHGLEDVVRLCGALPQPELRRRYADYDVFAFPTAWREPFAFAPLEAAAAGCATLISESSGNAEWMVDGVHCLKARRTPEAFAERLAAILDGEVDLEPVARRGQALVREDFHLPALLPRIESALRAAAGARRPAPGESRLSRAAVAVAEPLLA